MPLGSITLPLPADTAQVYAGDVDGDGRDELLILSLRRAASRPDAVVLTVQHLLADGRPGARGTVDLGTSPMAWDTGRGLWGIDPQGLVRLDPQAGGTPVRVARLPTVLTGLGPSTPTSADFTHDLDGDGRDELVVWSAGRYHAFRADGTSLGSVAAPARGSASDRREQGGRQLTAGIQPPPLVVADMDGDGKKDLLLPRGSHLDIHYTGSALGARAATVRLPVDVDPPPPPETREGTRREVQGVWFEDLDGDKKADLGVYRLVHDGNWFGSTAEWVWSRGTGNGFGAAQTVSFTQAAFALEPVDQDGDGDLDLRAILADVNLGNLARALVAREAKADLVTVEFDGGTYASRPRVLRELSMPIQDFSGYHMDSDGDVDGDRALDLVTDEGGDTLRVYRGGSEGFPSTPTWEAAVSVPDGEGLFVHDLTGDGRAEILVWGEGQPTATLLRVTP